jgi:AcrR family transcriptional regulator
MSRTRLTAEERHEQLVTAAVTAFSKGGYAGTTTDDVARLAGVSQPYVIRLLRTKQDLFIAAVHRATDRIESLWREAAAREPTLDSLGESYEGLLQDPELVRVLLHGYSASADPAIGDPVRVCFGRLYQVVSELTGANPDELREFFATGMLLTVLAAMRAIGPDAVAPPEPWVAELLGALGKS